MVKKKSLWLQVADIIVRLRIQHGGFLPLRGYGPKEIAYYLLHEKKWTDKLTKEERKFLRGIMSGSNIC